MSKKSSTAVASEKGPSQKQRILEAVAANPEASNADIAKLLGSGFDAAKVAGVKSAENARIRREKEREASKPLDLDTLASLQQHVSALGGAESIINQISDIRKNSEALVTAFGTLDRAQAAADATLKFQKAQAAVAAKG